MNKNKIIFTAIGGVTGLAVVALGVMAFMSSSENTEAIEELEGVKSSFAKVLKSEIPPDQSSINAFNENCKKLSSWYDEAIALASHGDIEINTNVTEAAFKKRMVDDARALSNLPGSSMNGKLVAENFGFGFKEIITGNSMPNKDKIPSMLRQWAEVKLFINILAESGVGEVTSLTVMDAPEENKAEEKQSAKGKKRNKRSIDDEEKKEGDNLPKPQNYALTFIARPAAMVKALNAFATSDRFIVVDDVSFMRADDALSTVLGGGKEKSSSTSASSSRRRRRSAEVQENNEENKEASVKKGMVTDPAVALPLTVTVKLSTYDFGSKKKNVATKATNEEAAE